MNGSIESIIKSNSKFFTESNFVTDYLRKLGWGIIMMLRDLTKGVESLFDAVYDFLNITNSAIFQDYYNQYRPLIQIAFVVSLIALGAIYMLSEKRPEVLRNFIIGLLVIFATPTFIQYLNEAIFASKSYLTGDLSITDSVISSNMTDLLYIDENGWNFKSGVGNLLDENSINHLDPSEHVNKKNDVSMLGRELFDTRIIVQSNGKIKTAEMGVKGWGDIFDPPYYYRFSIHFIQIPILLAIYILVIVFASYKTFLLIYEIMNSRIIGSLVAMDLTSGQKTKKVIEGFFSAYFSLFYILVSLKLYAVTQAYINAQSYGPIVRTFMLVFAGFIVMDGPNLVEKIFGYDIGFGSSAQKFMSLMRLGMEGMQLKYYAQNMGMGLGNIGKNLSDLGSALNNKFSLNNSKKADAPEPPTNPNSGEKAAYSSPEPNATTNSQNYNTSSMDNKSKDMPNSSDNYNNSELNPNGESTSGNDQILNGENGSSYSTNEPPRSGSELTNHDSSSSELPKGDSGVEDSSNENKSDMPVSTSDNNELNNAESSLQESGQHNEKDAQKYGYDSQNNANVSDKESNALPGNSTHQDSFANNPADGNENASNINNNPSYNSTEEKATNSSMQGEQPSNSYEQANASTGNNGNESKTGTQQSSHSGEPNAQIDNNKGVETTGNSNPDMSKTGATNSTGKSGNSDKQHNGQINSSKERLMDKKFGTESIAPQIISSLPKEEPNLNSADTSSDTPGTQDHTPITNTDNSGKYGENITGSEQMAHDESKFKPATENSPISSTGSPHTDGAALDQSNIKPISNNEKDTSSSFNGHSSGGKSEQDYSGTGAANHTDSNISKPAHQTTGTNQSNNGDLPIEPIGSNGTSSIVNSSPSLESTGLLNETMQASSHIPQESNFDSSRNNGYVSSDPGLRLNDSLLNNTETGLGKLENPRNFNVTDVINAANPELPKGQDEKSSGKASKTEESGKKSNSTRSKGVNTKKKG